MVTTVSLLLAVVVQAVSSQPDIVPPVYLVELKKLQDQIPPFPNCMGVWLCRLYLCALTSCRQSTWRSWR